MKAPSRVAIVTGGGRNIGRSIAIKLAEQGHAVVVCSRTQAEIDVTAGIIQEQGGRSAAIRADIMNEDDVTRVVAAGRELFGKIDVLVNNAGSWLHRPIDQTTRAEWEQVLGSNLTGVFLMSRAIVPVMKEQGGGRIINVSSLYGLTPGVNVAGYVAAKSGLIGFTKATARELRPFKINVNAVCPGAVDTSEEGEELEGKHYPLGQHLLPRDVAECVAFLASDAASQVTGAAIEVPGATEFEVQERA
jgi:NAD(P)-dependent dehydrogenase (short-subunit alcohol dehydrogenase family)